MKLEELRHFRMNEKSLRDDIKELREYIKTPLIKRIFKR